MDHEAAHLYRTLTVSLKPLISPSGLSDSAIMLDAIEAFRVLTADLGQVRRMSEADLVFSGPDQTILLWFRHAALHSLLSLPDRTTQALEVHSETSFNCLIHEICRISLLMYAQIWLHPIVNKGTNLARKLVSRIRPLLVAATSHRSKSGTLSAQYPAFFLWSVILSLMCAYEDWEVTGEAGTLEDISPLILETMVDPSPGSWAKMSGILEKFLWAPFESDLTGREAWQQACVLLPQSTLRSEN